MKITGGIKYPFISGQPNFLHQNLLSEDCLFFLFLTVFEIFEFLKNCPLKSEILGSTQRAGGKKFLCRKYDHFFTKIFSPRKSQKFDLFTVFFRIFDSSRTTLTNGLCEAILPNYGFFSRFSKLFDFSDI